MDSAYRMSLRARRMRPRDAAHAAAMMIADLAVMRALAKALPTLLHNLLASERLAGFCAEGVQGGDPEAKGGGGIVGFGLSGFLSDASAEAFLQAPILHFAVRILEQCLSDETRSGLLGPDAVARANANGGLNLAPICWLQRPRDRTSPRGAELMALGMDTFLRQHRGYNLKRMVKEVAAEEEARFVAAGYERLKTLNASDGAERVSIVLTRNHAERSQFGSALGLLFASRRPLLGFTRIQQQVLEGAVDDLSDQEIADHLGLSAHAINMRWRTIYERIDAHPEFAAVIFHASRLNHGGVAGAQKRRRVVAYVREHPEELRPFATASDRPADSAERTRGGAKLDLRPECG